MLDLALGDAPPQRRAAQRVARDEARVDAAVEPRAVRAAAPDVGAFVCDDVGASDDVASDAAVCRASCTSASVNFSWLICFDMSSSFRALTSSSLEPVEEVPDFQSGAEPDGPVDVSAASPDDARSDTDGSTGVAELPPKLTEYPEGAP